VMERHVFSCPECEAPITLYRRRSTASRGGRSGTCCTATRAERSGRQGQAHERPGIVENRPVDRGTVGVPRDGPGYGTVTYEVGTREVFDCPGMDGIPCGCRSPSTSLNADGTPTMASGRRIDRTSRICT
jgi:hypothetical protein